MFKVSECVQPNVLEAIIDREIDLIINLPSKMRSGRQETDGFKIRRLAIDHHIPLITNLQVAQVFLKCLTSLDFDTIIARPWSYFVKT